MTLRNGGEKALGVRGRGIRTVGASWISADSICPIIDTDLC